MTASCCQTTETLGESIAAALREKKPVMLASLAERFGVSELEVARALPDEARAFAGKDAFDTVWQALASWENATFIMAHLGSVIEIKGKIPEGRHGHGYFNLSGEGKGTIRNHILRIPAESFTENDADCLPTGTVLSVEGTPFDFRESKEIGRDMDVDCPQLRNGKGYDHNFILDGGDGEKVAAELYSPDTGIAMTVRTTMPGVQFYSGNVLDGPVGKSGVPYETNMGLCLETQYFPNAMSCPHFPSPVLHKGALYAHDTSFTFGCK